MRFPEITCSRSEALDLADFKSMDFHAVNNYDLPIDLMMENAGLQLARLVNRMVDTSGKVKIGVGNGNNGGGGLVAARRIGAWGYEVFLDTFTEITQELPAVQWARAMNFGAKNNGISNPDIRIDAYLGFSQKLPLGQSLLAKVEEANQSTAIKISLDIPTGFLGNKKGPFFKADKVLTLAAPKKILFDLPITTEIFVADLGIPIPVYRKFGMEPLSFHRNSILKLIRN